jgi:hypothetical protein
VSQSTALFAPGALPRLLLRFACAGLLLYLVFRVAITDDVASSEALLRAFAVGPWEAGLFILAAFVLLGVSFAVGAVRFSLLLRAAGIDVAWSTLFRALIVAGFFNLVLPGAILGDVYRVWDVRREAGEGSRALGIVVVERLLGFAALGCVGLVAAPFVPLEGDGRTLAWALLALCVLIAGANGLALHPRGQVWLRRLAAIAGRMFAARSTLGERIERALDATTQVAQQPATLWRAFGLSLANQGLPVVAVYVLALPLTGETPSPYWFAIIVPFVTLMSLIPISIGGTGVREGLYVVLFGAVGMASEVALVLSLCLLVTALLWAVVGFILFTFDRDSRVSRTGKLAT